MASPSIDGAGTEGSQKPWSPEGVREGSYPTLRLSYHSTLGWRVEGRKEVFGVETATKRLKRMLFETKKKMSKNSSPPIKLPQSPTGQIHEINGAFRTDCQSIAADCPSIDAAGIEGSQKPWSQED